MLILWNFAEPPRAAVLVQLPSRRVLPTEQIFLYKGFLTHEECDELIATSRPKLHRSGVVNAISGEVRGKRACCMEHAPRTHAPPMHATRSWACTTFMAWPTHALSS